MSRSKAPYHHGDLRKALLAQVGQIVRKKGVGVVSMREVARRARVSHGAPAHHFGNKAGLLTAFAAQGYDRLANAIEAALRPGPASAADALAAMGVAYVRFAIDNPEHFAIMFPGDGLTRDDPAFVAARNRSHALLVGVIDRAAAEGLITADPMLVSTAAWSLVHGLAALWLSGRLRRRAGAADPGALIDGVTRLFASSVIKSL